MERDQARVPWGNFLCGRYRRLGHRRRPIRRYEPDPSCQYSAALGWPGNPDLLSQTLRFRILDRDRNRTVGRGSCVGLGARWADHWIAARIACGGVLRRLFPGYPTWPRETRFAQFLLVSGHEFGGGAPGIQLGPRPTTDWLSVLHLSSLRGDGSDHTDPRLLLDHFCPGPPACLYRCSLPTRTASDYRHPCRLFARRSVQLIANSGWAGSAGRRFCGGSESGRGTVRSSLPATINVGATIWCTCFRRSKRRMASTA